MFHLKLEGHCVGESDKQSDRDCHLYDKDTEACPTTGW